MDGFAEAGSLLPPRRAVVLLLAGCGVAAGLGMLSGRLLRYLRPGPGPRLVRVAEVSGLFIYPVKSCKGISQTQAECSRLGLESGSLKDRHWIIVDEACHMITGRVEPSLVLVSVSRKNDELCLNATGMEELRIPFELPKTNPVKILRVFGTDIEGRDCGDKAAEWITAYLKNTKLFRIMFYEPAMTPRQSKDKSTLFRDSDKIAYSDLSACMLMSEASVEDLNTRLEKKVKMENFRPVIVVKDCKPYEEDTWNAIQIGNVKFSRVMGCGRCIFTTVDPDTGIIDRKEPLQTLKSYRQCDPSEKHIYKSDALLGVHFRIDKTGVIQLGDPVYKICGE